MYEKFTDKIRRKWTELRSECLKRLFKWAIKRYDQLSAGTFLAISWGIDEITDYHVIAERSYPDHSVFGTRVTWYDVESPEEVTDADATDQE